MGSTVHAWCYWIITVMVVLLVHSVVCVSKFTPDSSESLLGSFLFEEVRFLLFLTPIE